MTTIPAGLEDGNLGLYRNGDKVHGLFSGTRYCYNQLPAECREPFAVELINDQKAFDCLRDEMGIAPEMMEEQFVWCRYGQFNDVPDYCFTTNKTKPNAPGCDNERTCKGFGKVCLMPDGKNGKLTKQEYFIVREVVRGLADKDISVKLNIELSTVRTHMQRIHHKLDVYNRTQIFLWAKEHGIE